MNLLKPDWQILESIPTLMHNEVVVWRIQVIPASLDLFAFLSPDEQERAERYKSDSARNQFCSGRAALRILCGHYMDLPTNKVAFQFSPFNKPALKNGGFYFNLAHSHRLILIAFSKDFELGIDLEWIHPISEMSEIARQFFSPAEAAALRSLPIEERQNAFFTCWTRKEAFIKAVGEGLSFPLDQFEVTLNPDEPAILKSILGSQEAASSWKLSSFTPAQGYLAALAYQGASLPISFIDFRFIL